MSTVTGIVYVNPIEPGPLSMRVSSGIDTIVNLSFLDQLGDPITTDLLAQLELTSRSLGWGPVWCAALATDVVNGKARAVIPANTLADPNGYRLRLYGTVQQQLMLLATGVVDLIEAVGPTTMPIGVIDTIDLTLTRGVDALLHVTTWADAVGNAEFDLASTTISASVYDSQGGAVLAPFTVTPDDANEVDLMLPAAVVDTLPDLCWWSLVASNASGVNTLCEGKVTVRDAPA